MRETVTRGLSGLVYIILLTLSIFYSQYTFLLLFGIFLSIAVFEFCNLVSLRKELPIVIAVFGYIVFTLLPDNPLISLFLLFFTLIISVKCILFLFDVQATNFEPVMKYVFLAGYILLPFILLAKIPFQNNSYHLYQPEIIMSIFIIIWTNDTFAFIVGKSIGKNKLFQRISPKKTMEGFIGGVGFAVLAASLIAWYYIHQPVYIWIIIALIVSVIGTVGDLVESKFKRVSGVKDSGAIMPGHGGILDRLDSVIFAAPFVFLFYQILNYVP